MKVLISSSVATLVAASILAGTALADPTIHKRLVDLAQDIFPPEQQTPEALNVFQKAEMDKWWPIIKSAGIKAE